MSNPYFQFKQFIVHQDSCAMKVSTDACIQGAWTPVPSCVCNVLDVGAGTGLLSLMMAQRIPHAQIDAIEQAEPAAVQAIENAAQSPFARRIRVVQGDAAIWTSKQQYDLIICNPPFFKNSLTGPDAERNAARHLDTLNMQSLLRILLRNLAADGSASVMWPVQEHEHFVQLAIVSGIYLQQVLCVQDNMFGRIIRIVGLYSKVRCIQPVIDSLVIKDNDGGYTSAFRNLLTPFYLHL